MKIIAHSESDMPRIARAIRRIPFPVVVEFRECKPTRSTEQNSYLWAMLSDISRQSADLLGRHYSADTLHEYCKARFLGLDVVNVKGDCRPISKSTTKLTVREMIDYCDQISAWAIDELGVELTHERAGMVT